MTFKNKVHALLEQYLDYWFSNPRNNGKEPFVSIKIFEFDPGRMKRTTRLESRWVPVKKTLTEKTIRDCYTQHFDGGIPMSQEKKATSKITKIETKVIHEQEFIDHHVMCDVEILEDPILTTYTKITSTTSKIVEENNVVLSSGLPIELITQEPVNLKPHFLDIDKCLDKIMEYKECVIPQINKETVVIKPEPTISCGVQTEDFLFEEHKDLEMKLYMIYKEQVDLIKANDINKKINKIYGLSNTIAENMMGYQNNLEALNSSKSRYRKLHIGKVLHEKVEGMIEEEGYISAIPSIIDYLGNLVMKHLSDNDPVILQIRTIYAKALSRRLK